MRAAIILAGTLAAISADAAERTWTIAREVYTAEGELIAVRGNMAFLKIDGKVEEVPIERLSAQDQNYLSSLSLAPILPGPAASDGTRSLVVPAAAQEEMPLPGSPDGPAPQELELNAPDLAPAYGGEPLRSPATQPRTRFDRYGRILPPQSGTATSYVAPWGEPRQRANPNARTDRRGPQLSENDRDARSRDDDDGDDRPGIFGFRARRLEREHAAANRSR
jgi:hypothetical protein